VEESIDTCGGDIAQMVWRHESMDMVWRHEYRHLVSTHAMETWTIATCTNYGYLTLRATDTLPCSDRMAGAADARPHQCAQESPCTLHRTRVRIPFNVSSHLALSRPHENDLAQESRTRVTHKSHAHQSRGRRQTSHPLPAQLYLDITNDPGCSTQQEACCAPF